MNDDLTSLSTGLIKLNDGTCDGDEQPEMSLETTGLLVVAAHAQNARK